MLTGDLVFAQGAAATPQHLLQVMTDYGKAEKLKNITVCHMHTEGPAPYALPENAGQYKKFDFPKIENAIVIFLNIYLLILKFRFFFLNRCFQILFIFHGREREKRCRRRNFRLHTHFLI